MATTDLYLCRFFLYCKLRKYLAIVISQLSQEFDRHMQVAENFVKERHFGGAEAHRLIAESIHETLSTFEAINE